MRYKPKNLCVLLFLCIGITTLQAQQAILATGGEASGSGGSVSYSIGQVLYTTFPGSNGSLANGIQQPYEISIHTGIDISYINLNYSLYPNPTSDYLTIEVEGKDGNIMSYQLYNTKGKKLKSGKVKSTSTLINMADLPKSIYLLKLTDHRKLVKTFKIVKK